VSLDARSHAEIAAFAEHLVRARRRTADRAPAVLAVFRVFLEHPDLVEHGPVDHIRELAGIRRTDAKYAVDAMRAVLRERRGDPGSSSPLELPSPESGRPEPGTAMERMT
jgi:hypothetical protein